MGFSVQLFETLAWAEELLDPRPRPTSAGSRACTPRPGYACFAGRAEAARANAHRATELEVDARYDACEPGYASFVEALVQRVLRRPRSLRRAHRRRSRERYGSDRGLRPRRRTSTASSRAAGSTRRSRSPRSRSPRRDRSATPTGSRTRCGSRAWRSRRPTCAARSRRGTRASRSCASTACSSSRASSHATRLACTRPTASPRPRSVLFADAIAAFQRAGNVPQLIITLASVPALFERLDRLAPAAMLARRAVARAVEPPPRPGARRPRRSASPRSSAPSASAELTAAGAALDLGGAAVYARQQIDVARRDPSPRRTPGAARRPEPPGDRGAPPRGRRPTAGEIATQLFISARTAEHHIQNIYTKIGVSSRAAATRWAVEHGVVATRSPPNRGQRKMGRSTDAAPAARSGE